MLPQTRFAGENMPCTNPQLDPGPRAARAVRQCTSALGSAARNIALWARLHPSPIFCVCLCPRPTKWNADSTFYLTKRSSWGMQLRLCQFGDFKFCLSLYKFLTILATIPVTAATTECSFNRLRCLKSLPRLVKTSRRNIVRNLY